MDLHCFALAVFSMDGLRHVLSLFIRRNNVAHAYIRQRPGMPDMLSDVSIVGQPRAAHEKCTWRDVIAHYGRCAATACRGMSYQPRSWRHCVAQVGPGLWNCQAQQPSTFPGHATSHSCCASVMAAPHSRRSWWSHRKHVHIGAG